MFLGHFAVGFASKRLAPKTGLAVLLTAALLIDLLWPLFLLAGIEVVRIAPGDTAFTPLRFVSYPITHSLMGCLLWAAAFSGVYLSIVRYPRGALVIFGAVLSHWFLDAVTHRPDLPLTPLGPYVGLGLWNSTPATVAVEGALFALGTWLYASHGRGRMRLSLITLIVLLVAIYSSLIWGPPPPSPDMVAYGGLLSWLFPIWAALIDRKRRGA